MQIDWIAVSLFTFAWIAYAILHSLLASLGIKHWVATEHPQFMPYYRLSYNLFACVSLLPIAYLWFIWRQAPLWEWHGWLQWLMYALSAVAIIGFYWSSKYYDMQEFLGLRQIRAQEQRVEDQETFQLSPFHRHVRHPWYSLGLLLIWTQEMDIYLLISASFITLYFMLGSRLEENKLRAYHGAVYAEYQQRVPGLFPRPWRNLSKQQAENLISRA